MENIFVLYIQYWHYINLIVFPAVWYILMNYLHKKATKYNQLLPFYEDRSFFNTSDNHLLAKKLRGKTIKEVLGYLHSIHMHGGLFIIIIFISGIYFYKNSGYIIFLDILFFIYISSASVFQGINELFLFKNILSFINSYFYMLLGGKILIIILINLFFKEQIINILKNIESYSPENLYSIELLLSMQICLIGVGIYYSIKTLLLKRIRGLVLFFK